MLAAVLLAAWWLLPHVRHRVIASVAYDDARVTDAVRLPDSPAASAAPLPRATHVRVVLIDGLAADNTRFMPAWRALCDRGVTLAVDVGFPTVSLPVEVALWTGLTQQQTGIVMRSDHPLDAMHALATIPSNAVSVAVAEDHGWIVRSLGFGEALPRADPDDPATVKDDAPDAWRARWLAAATDAVASWQPLVFVHLLGVDTMGHRVGRASPAYATAAGIADSELAALLAADRESRWFVLSDHGHLDGGGHGGEEREVRQVQGCIAGPGVAAGGSHVAGLVHVADVARALADSLGVALDPRATGRHLAAALAAPLAADQAVPPLPLGTGALAIALLLVGAAISYIAAGGRAWLWPWWLPIACVSLVAVRGLPTLSMPMVYAPAGRAMYVTWLPSLAIAAAAAYLGATRAGALRAALAQLALPYAALAAAITASGAWPTLLGAAVAPVVPHYTAWLSALWLIAAHGSAAVALAVLGTCVRLAFDRRAPAETPRSEPAAD